MLKYVLRLLWTVHTLTTLPWSCYNWPMPGEPPPLGLIALVFRVNLLAFRLAARFLPEDTCTPRGTEPFSSTTGSGMHEGAR